MLDKMRTWMGSLDFAVVLAALRDDVGQAAREFLCVVQMQELVGPVSIGERPENSCDEERSPWP